MLALPPPPSWYPGHMAAFAKALPNLLPKTHVVLEVRDIRLPLTSINPQLENALAQWRGNSRGAGKACEHIVVYTKRDLVPSWGERRLRQGLSRHFDQHMHFTTPASPPSIKALHKTLVSIAKENKDTINELNVLVIGMPNVGKSTLLNYLRGAGVGDPTKRKHALLTSAMPGHTKKLSTRLKLSTTHPIYALDSPGVMIPFFGHGDEGKERGVRLALAAGIKESLYDEETLVSYLLYNLWRENPQSPSYQSLLTEADASTLSQSSFTFPTIIEGIARRIGAIRKGGELDLPRAAQHTIRWWREGKHVTPSEGPLAPSTTGHPSSVRGWGLDFYFGGQDIPLRPPSRTTSSPSDGLSEFSPPFESDSPLAAHTLQQPQNRFALEDPVQHAMNAVIDRFVHGLKEKPEGLGISASQQKKREREEKKREREKKRAQRGSDSS